MGSRAESAPGQCFALAEWKYRLQNGAEGDLLRINHSKSYHSKSRLQVLNFKLKLSLKFQGHRDNSSSGSIIMGPLGPPHSQASRLRLDSDPGAQANAASPGG